MSSKGKFKLHSQDASRRGFDLALLIVSGLTVIAILSALTINLLDQSQRHVEKIRGTHVPGPSGSKVVERENEADVLVQEQVNKNPRATEISFEHYELTDVGLKYIGKPNGDAFSEVQKHVDVSPIINSAPLEVLLLVLVLRGGVLGTTMEIRLQNNSHIFFEEFIRPSEKWLASAFPVPQVNFAMFARRLVITAT